jgi:predicted HTH domain antitoxin
MPVTISDETLHEAGLSERELLVELACLLFDKERLHLWPAAKLARMSRVEFENELHARNIAIYRPTVEDLAHDMAALDQIAKRSCPS